MILLSMCVCVLPQLDGKARQRVEQRGARCGRHPFSDYSECGRRAVAGGLASPFGSAGHLSPSEPRPRNLRPPRRHSRRRASSGLEVRYVAVAAKGTYPAAVPASPDRLRKAVRNAFWHRKNCSRSERDRGAQSRPRVARREGARRDRIRILRSGEGRGLVTLCLKMDGPRDRFGCEARKRSRRFGLAQTARRKTKSPSACMVAGVGFEPTTYGL